MIELKVAKYCHNCPYFQPICDTNGSRDLFSGKTVSTNSIITCENGKKCENIAKYLLDYAKAHGGKL